MAWLGWALVWRGLVWFDVHVKLNYQLSLLSRLRVGGEKSKVSLNPDWAELGNKQGLLYKL